MSLLSLASGASAYRGYEYFKYGKVLRCTETAQQQYEGVVAGQNGASYEVLIDPAHPRKSHCSCPHAAGRRIICKHMIALFFAAHPEEAESYHAELVAWQEEEERRYEKEQQELLRTVNKMKKAELQEELLRLLEEGPEWQYKDFLERYCIVDPYDED